jgi:predicted dinucleotide-binding enzyme
MYIYISTGGSSLYTPSYNNNHSNSSYGNSTAAATSSTSRAMQPLQATNTTAVTAAAVTRASLAPLIQAMFSGNKGVTIADIMSSVPQLAQQQQQQQKKTSALRIVQEVLQDMQEEFSIYMRDGAYYAF